MAKRILNPKDKEYIENRIRAGEKFEMPGFEKVDGLYVSTEPVQISTLKGFREYIKKHQEIVDYLGDNYKDIVSKIYRKNLAVLTDPMHRSIYGKVLSGDPVKNKLVYESAYATDSVSILNGFLRTLEAKNLGIEGAEVQLPHVKRVPAEFLQLFKSNKQGFLVPEINKDGLVVEIDKSSEDFTVKLVPVSVTDVTYEQVREYLASPFNGDFKNNKVNFYKVMDLCTDAYSLIGTDDVADKTKELVNYCISVYPLALPQKQQTQTIQPDGEEETPVVPEENEEENPAAPEEDEQDEALVEGYTLRFKVEEREEGYRINNNFKFSRINKLEATSEIAANQREQ